MNKKYKKYILCLIIVNILFILLFIIFFKQDNIIGEYFSKCFFDNKDRFGDFYNPIIYASDMQLVDNEWTNAPPFLHFISYFVNVLIVKIYPNVVLDGLFMTSFLGYKVWLIIVTITSLMFCLQFKKLINIKNSMLICLLGVCLSYPYIYTIDRGNYVLFTALFINMFIISYENNSKWSPLWLGLATALKLYPALLGIIYIKDKKLKQAILSVAIFFILTLLSLFFFSRLNYSFSDTLIDWLIKVKDYSSIGNGHTATLINNCSIKSLLMFISYDDLETITALELVNSISWASLPINLLLIILLYRCLFFKNHDIYLISTLIMIIFPLESGIYNLLLFIIPVLYWLYMENDKYVMLYSLILLIGKPCVSLINPIFTILIIIRILMLRKNIITKLKGDKNEFRIFQR